jgi:CRP-like cAMP-binding protein
MRKVRGPAANHLLADMSRADFGQLLPHLAPIELSFAEVLVERNARSPYVYFPTSGIIGIHTPIIGGGTTLALIGREGMVGSAVAAGIRVPPTLMMVQRPGGAMRIEARRFQRLAGSSVSLQREIHRYTAGLLRRARQMAVCNSYHSVEARLARCLLEASDQARSDEIQITQESLANMIGGRRIGVNTAATSMRGRKLIDYSRGRLLIVNRKRLRRLACACYEPPAS